MNTVIALVIFAVAAAVSAAKEGPWIGGFRVKFDMGEGIGSSFFYDMPRNVTQAISDGMIKATPPTRATGPLSKLQMFCLEYYYFCILFDDTDYVAGLQIGFSKDEMIGAVFNYTIQGFVPWIVEIDNASTELWVNHLYFISSEQLDISKEIRIAERNPMKTLQHEGVWVTSFYGELYFISHLGTDIAEKTAFTEQACFPWMGLHYYYNMTANTLCEADSILPWFPMIESNELIAVGFLTSGVLNLRSKAKNVFESPGTDVLKMIVPDGPQCIYDLSDTNGFTTMHIYFVEEPWKIPCPNPAGNSATPNGSLSSVLYYVTSIYILVSNIMYR